MVRYTVGSFEFVCECASGGASVSCEGARKGWEGSSVRERVGVVRAALPRPVAGFGAEAGAFSRKYTPLPSSTPEHPLSASLHAKHEGYQRDER